MMRNFSTGATRDSDDSKLDYEGFLSPLVLQRFAEYMHKHRFQADGNMRASDNWQKGIPLDAYMKSMTRHFMDVWKNHRGIPSEDLEESLTALMFNVMGYLYETLRTKQTAFQTSITTFQDTQELLAKWPEERSVREYQNAWDDKIYTHRYGALAHDQEAIEEDSKIEEGGKTSYNKPEGYYYEDKPFDPESDFAVACTPGMEYSEMVGVSKKPTQVSHAKVASETHCACGVTPCVCGTK